MTEVTLHPGGTARAAMGAAGNIVPDVLVERAALLGDPSAVFVARELVRLVEAPANARDMMRWCTALLLLVQQGSTRVQVNGNPMVAMWRALGASSSEVERLRSVAAWLTEARAGSGPLRELADGGEGYRPLVVSGEWVAFQRWNAVETRAGGVLKSRLAAGPSRAAADVAPAVDDVLARPVKGPRGPVVLAAEQQRAVRLAARGGTTVITGGPGTGKTSIIVAIVRALARLGVDASAMALAAPTGKAADRMQHAVDDSLRAIGEPSGEDNALVAAPPRASTLHRLLGWLPSAGRFRHHAREPLEHRVVIVDEASMIDVALLERLLDALPVDASLVLLGDADQLPSVDPGAVLRDLVAAAPGVVTRLSVSHRMDPSDAAGSAILRVAHQVCAGHGRVAFDRDAGGRVVHVADELAFSGVELLEAPKRETREAFLSRWFGEVAIPRAHEEDARRTVRLDGAAPRDEHERRHVERVVQHVESARLLCAVREAPLLAGIAGVNAWCRARLARQRGDARASSWLAGEPVMVHSNDYERELFNGDQGVVLFAEGTRRGRITPHVFFRRAGRINGFPLDAVAHLVEPAWATTVHKAQGSEFDRVGMILPSVESPALARELLYTAITRARRSVTLVGELSVVEAGAGRASERVTGLREALVGAERPVTP